MKTQLKESKVPVQSNKKNQTDSPGKKCAAKSQEAIALDGYAMQA